MSNVVNLEKRKTQTPGSVWEVLKVCTKLGLTSFGGPVAHLGYFREEYVKRRRWLDEQSYADLVALCQFLPGPASSQVGIAVGMLRAGMLGGIAAWIGFTLPSALLLVLFAYLLHGVDIANAHWFHGLMIVAVAVVAQAVWGMARTLAPDKPRGSIAILAAIVCLLFPSPLIQVLVIVAGAAFGRTFIKKLVLLKAVPLRIPFGKKTAITAWIVFLALLIGLPLLRLVVHDQTLAVFDSFYRTGALVFGGGHVVLPLLQEQVVPTGWVSSNQFLAGYGAAQAMPGPLFTFAAYLGAVMHTALPFWESAALTLVAIFLPAFLLVVGALPFWNAIRVRPSFISALGGINAAVVGILLAALYSTVWSATIFTSGDFVLALLAFGLLVVWKLPPWVVVVVGAALGGFFN